MSVPSTVSRLFRRVRPELVIFRPGPGRCVPRPAGSAADQVRWTDVLARARRTLLLVGAVALVAVVMRGMPAGAGTLDFGPPGPPSIGNFSPLTLNGAPQLTSLAITPFS